ncbi:hypothetical protein FQN54_003496 [Arachnomyces sp. PD_36]|nr:hypothetical protein FQN54_003496 [Arachnomyces sp. PD_36]
MKFQATAITAVAALLSLSSAASIPTQSLRKNAVSSDLTKRESNDYCGDSSFENQTSGGSPLVSDCQQIITNIAGGGDWSLGMFQRKIAEHGTCAFGAQVDGTVSKVGNQDVIDLIQASIDQFQWNGLVGAQGEMNCGYIYDVRWAIYHN